MSDIKVKAIAVRATPPPTPPPPPIESVILEVDYDTARFLRELLSRIGGNSGSVNRHRVFKLIEAFNSIGIMKDPWTSIADEFFTGDPRIIVK